MPRTTEPLADLAHRVLRKHRMTHKQAAAAVDVPETTFDDLLRGSPRLERGVVTYLRLLELEAQAPNDTSPRS